MYYCCFWAFSQSEIDNVVKYFNEDGTSYNWGKSKGDSMLELLGIATKTLDNGGFFFIKLEFSARYCKTQVWITVMSFSTQQY